MLLRNAASGGFSGFNFPVLDKPVGMHRWSNVCPKCRPLQRFDGNTAHSTGYFWAMAGAVYVGGKVWVGDSDGKLYYSSGRYEHDTRDDSGKPIYMDFVNSKVWLGQWGLSHWGKR